MGEERARVFFFIRYKAISKTCHFCCTYVATKVMGVSVAPDGYKSFSVQRIACKR